MIDREKEAYSDERPPNLEDVFHEIKSIETQGEGVFYFVAHDGSDLIMCEEYYVVDIDSPIISKEAKKYGKPVGGHPSLLLYSFAEERGGYKIIEYEVYRNAIKNKVEGYSNSDLRTLAYYNMEYHPEYFGSYPVPMLTPCGFTVRHRILANGIFFLETDQGMDLLAVCYPVWECEFSDYLRELALMTEYDSSHGIDNTLGFLFFKEPEYCLVVFELLSFQKEWLQGLVLRPQLMNAIWKYHPEYATTHNMEEQHGLHDGFGMLLNTLGHEVELSSSVDRMISITPNVDCNFFVF